MAIIYDNIERKFSEGLEGLITNIGVKRVDFCVGYFNLRGWDVVENEIDNLSGDYVEEDYERKLRYCRLLIGMHRPAEELIRSLYKEQVVPDAEYVQNCKRFIALDFKNQLVIGVPTGKDEFTLRRLCKQLREGKVCVKLYLREPLHAKLYLAYRPDDNFNPIPAILGSSNLTFAGLTGNGELNAEFGDSDSALKLSRWFDERWNDKFSLDITDELIQVIEDSWAGEKLIPPYYIYLKVAYHLSQEAREGVKEFTLPAEFRNELFDFQQTAVKIAAKHLNNDKRGGAMIGDVVGLGKTITACAVAKIFEMTYASSTLIICPANLQEMWKKYVKKYDLKADVMSMSKPIDVENSRYYRLIIVDESHNLRNEQGTRYQNIKSLITYQDSKVLLLTATPYNKDFCDLSAQLKLFVGDGQDLGIRPELYIAELGGERAFLQRHSEVFIRSIKAFEKSAHVEDWNDLMKLFLVRRTRSFIRDNYAKTDPKDGRKYLQFNDGRRSYFPTRIPISIKFPTENNDQHSRLYSDKMLDLMTELTLPRYGLSQFLDENKIKTADNLTRQLAENLSRAGQRMMGFCRSTFFKRIDSSGFSFLLTLYRHILRNMLFVYAIENKLPIPIGDENSLPEYYTEDNDENTTVLGDDMKVDNGIEDSGVLSIPTDLDIYKRKASEYYQLIVSKNNVAWIDSKYFKRTLKQRLLVDCKVLVGMIELCGKWNPDTDQKLNELQKLIEGKHKNDKVIVFTQYSDTATYLYNQLKKRGVCQIEVATGNSENPTDLAERFSPKSNEKDIPAQSQLRILIATDVLSEGQNLQDSHVVVNFDLPWAIIRLIQRAGRVDRIGQTSETIQCYSFFPADGVERIINLRGRLNARINENANVVGSDEVFFEGNEQNLRDMFNEKSGVLDDDDDNDVDISSQAYQIWKNATDARPELRKIIPNLCNTIYSTKSCPNEVNDGVITYAKTYNDFDILKWYDSDGNLVSQSQKKILQTLACDFSEPALEPLENHHELVKKAVDDIADDTIPVGGILGNRFSTRFRIIALLEKYYEKPTDLFFSEENKLLLKMAIDNIYNNPLLESSRFILGRMFRTSSQDDIVEYVIEAQKKGTLCRMNENTVKNKDPQIICSMGLKLNA